MWKSIFKTTALAGTMDITAACIQSYFSAGVQPATVLRFVASGVFGNTAFTGNESMLVFGLLFHFIIAFACTACYFLLYPKIKLLHINWFANAVAIAVVAWCVTTLIIRPLSNASPFTFDITKSLISIAILIVCIGLPISISAEKFYKRKKIQINQNRSG